MGGPPAWRGGEAVVARCAGLPAALLSAFAALPPHPGRVLLVCKSLSGSPAASVFSCSLPSRVRIRLPAPGAHQFERRVVS